MAARSPQNRKIRKERVVVWPSHREKIWIFRPVVLSRRVIIAVFPLAFNMMFRRSVSFLLLFLLAVFCTAKVINTDASSSYLTKLSVGIAQSLQWLSQYLMPQLGAPHRSPRKVQLALVGLGRTGSTSFSAALKQLGYAPIHDDEAAEVSDIYAALLDGSLTMDEANEAIGERGFDAPMISLHKYVQWAATAPDIKVILTVRSPQSWAESWLTVTPAAFFPEQRPFCWIPSIRQLADFNREIMLNVPTNGHPDLYDDVPTLVEGYRAWTKYVVDTVPPERLLVFNVQQGWEPLCKFLEKPVPTTPFPHINDRFVVATIIKVFQIIAWTWPILMALPFLILYYCCVVRPRRRRSSTSRRNDGGVIEEEPKKEV